MIVKINKSKANGTISAPPSKSMAHRLIICASLANGVSVISNVDFSEDIKATIDCVKTLGTKVDIDGSTVTVDGSNTVFNHKESKESLEFMCRESGSTMRFFMGIAMTLPAESKFFGSETLRNRPFGVYEEILKNQNLLFEKKDEYISIKGAISEKDIVMPGNISSQFVTGMLLALAIMGEGGSVTLTGGVESKSYINMTLKAMRDFGVKVDWEGDEKIVVKEGSTFISGDKTVEGDYSNAAFLDAFNVLGGNVKVEGLDPLSLQGDKVYADYFKALSEKKATLDLADCPDLGPVLFAVAAANHGGLFTSTARLKIKESDRGSVMCEELAKFGVKSRMSENEIEIEGNGLNVPAKILSGHNDHRIVMSLSLLLTLTGGSIDEAEAVRKSYPGFFEDIKKLGVSLEETNGMD